jgi:hypothetical protein
MTLVSSGSTSPRRIARESNTEGAVALPASHDQIVLHVGASCACPVSGINWRREQFRHRRRPGSVDYASVFVATGRVRGIIQSCAEL